MSPTEFWSWFTDNSRAFEGSLSPSNPLVVELDRRIHQFDDGLSWELGPEGESGLFLAITPSGQAELMPLVESILAAAPELDGWTWLAFRPRKEWNRVVDWNVRVDVSRWRYGLVAMKDPLVLDVTFVARSEKELSKIVDLEHFAYFLLLSEVGEEHAMKVFDRIEVVLEEAVDAETRAKLGPIEHLGPHVDSLVEAEAK